MHWHDGGNQREKKHKREGPSTITGTILRKSPVFAKGLPSALFGSSIHQVLWLIKVDNSDSRLPFRIVLSTVSATYDHVPYGTPLGDVAGCGEGDRVEITDYEKVRLIVEKGDEMLEAIWGADANFADHGKWVTVEPVYQARETDIRVIWELTPRILTS